MDGNDAAQTAILNRLSELEARLQGHSDVLASMANLTSQVHQVSELLAEVVLKVGLNDDEKPGRMPRPAPQWHKISEEEREAEFFKLDGWLSTFTRMFGHMINVGPCWKQHPLACQILEITTEIHMMLFLGDRRPPAILMGEADFMIRVFPGLMQIVTKETVGCTKHTGDAR